MHLRFCVITTIILISDVVGDANFVLGFYLIGVKIFFQNLLRGHRNRERDIIEIKSYLMVEFH